MKRRSSKRSIRISDFYCKVCNAKIPLPRTRREREKYHIKDMYCPFCKEIRAFYEVRSGDDYKSIKAKHDEERSG